jgi:hypothetical protein
MELDEDSDVGSGNDDEDDESSDDGSVELIDDAKTSATRKGKAPALASRGAQRKERLQVIDEVIDEEGSESSGDESESGESV